MIRFLMPLLSGVLVAGLASAAPLIIDDFSLDQGPIQAAYSNPASDTVTNDGSFIGPAGTSTRTIDVNGNGHPPPSGQWTTAEVGGGMFEFTSAADVLGNTSLVYEFIGGVDLSKHIGFTFHDVFADHPFDYEVSIFDLGGGSSFASGTFNLPLAISSDVLLSFSSFTGLVDLANVDRLMFTLISDEVGLDFNMTQISAAIPVPAAGFFLITALAGLGLLRSRKMAEAA